MDAESLGPESTPVTEACRSHPGAVAYAVAGVLFGCVFPILATILDVLLHELPLTLGSALAVQSRQPLHWVIDTAPLFLGLLATLAGRRQDMIHALNERLAFRLRHEIELDRLVADISSELIGLRADQVDAGVVDVLRRIAGFVGADRCHFFSPIGDDQALELTQEWHASDIEPRSAEMRQFGGGTPGSPVDRLRGMQVVRFDRAADAGPYAPLLEASGIRSMLCVPVPKAGPFRGAIGLDGVLAEREWGPEIEALLRSVGEMIVAALDRVQTLRQLRLQATALESAVNAMLITSPDGRIEWVNPAFCKLSGWTREEVVGKTPAIQDSGRHGAEFFEQMWREIVAGCPWQGEILNRRRDGSIYEEEMTITPVKDESEQVIAFIAIKQDITPRKQVERELRRAEEAARVASRQKSEFLANMSHEIRTPLNGVIGMTELALDTELTDEQRDDLLTIKGSADALLVILNDILDFSKIEAGKLDLEAIPFDLHDCVRQAVRSLAPLADEKALELILQIGSEVPERVVGDPGRLRQVLFNLVGNAIKFTERGEVLVRVNDEQASVGNATIRFAVADTGIGIPAEKLDLIFEEFRQADGSMTRRFGGTGLGLAISRNLVALMRGEIAVESEPGAGSTFRFTVRLDLDAESCGDAGTPGHVDLRGLDALIVDDNETNRRIVRDNLRSWGVRTIEAESGESALDVLAARHAQGERPRLAVIDAQMPGMDGFELTEQIRKDSRFADTRVLMLTSAGRRGDGARCRETGIDGYLIKPVAGLDMLAAIRTLLGRGPEAASTNLVTHHTLRENRYSLRVLLAEDNVINRRVASRLLETLGHEVEAVDDGIKVIEALQRNRFDLVLMDVQMPELDGIEATRRIRRNERTAGGHIPIIALTAHAMKRDRERCLEAGMDGYVSKPISRCELTRVLQDVAEGRVRSIGEPAPDGAPVPA